MSSLYQPLYLIDRDQSFAARLRRFFSFGLTPRAKHIQQQVASRPAFPDAAWGGPGIRLDVAKALSEIIRDEIGWPNANFQPDDPMKMVLFNFGWDESFQDGCEIECSILRMEQLLKVNLTEAEDATLWSGTFGDAVDMLISKSPDAAVCLRRNQPRPLEGSGALEAESCASLAAFLDIRSYLVNVLRLDKKRISPATRIGKLAGRRTRAEIEDYVTYRFGVAQTLRPHRPWRRMVGIGLWVPPLIAIGGVICFGWIALAAAGFALIVAFAVALRRLPEARRMSKYRVHTFADLVGCIRSERLRQKGLRGA